MFVQLNAHSSPIVNQYTCLWEFYPTLLDAEQKTLLVVDKHNKLIGTITPGDVTRLLGQRHRVSNVNPLEAEAQDVCFTEPKYLYESVISKGEKAAFREIASDASSVHRLYPVVTSSKILVGMYIPELSLAAQKHIGKHAVSQGSPPLIIAEIGVNHNGRLSDAKELVLHAKNAGANIVKFQLRDMPEVYTEDALTSSNELTVEYTVDHLKKTNLSFDEIAELFRFARDQDIDPICTAFDTNSLKLVSSLNPICYKLASCDISNYPLICALRDAGKPVIYSTGMSTLSEILQCHNILSTSGSPIFPLHCVSVYPAPSSHLEMPRIKQLSNLLGTSCGYSSHDNDIIAPILAVAMGATIIEKHITLDKSAVGPDHKASLEPDDFKRMCLAVREAWQAIQTNGTVSRRLSQIEKLNQVNLSKTLYPKKDISKGTILRPDMFLVRSPGGGISPMILSAIHRYHAKTDLLSRKPVTEDDIEIERLSPHGNIESSRATISNILIGCPVRYRDFSDISNLVNPDSFEFHLTYRDVGSRPSSKIFESLSASKISFHAPECFEEDHLIDLCSLDQEYRHKSIEYIQNTIDHIDQHFARICDQPYPLVINAGGFNRDAFITDSDQINKLIDSLATSLRYLTFKCCKPYVQTMPPFPWHLGGRSHHNLFTTASQSVQLAKDLDLSICIDLSHTFMASQHFDLDFYSELDEMLEVSDYLHVSDAASVDDEGLQIGDGKIDFEHVARLLNKRESTSYTAIVEVWQGHLSLGKGFNTAIQELRNRSW